MTYAETCWQKAFESIGVQEEPIGSNWGRWVRVYLAFVGVFQPAAWCCAFVLYKLYQSASLAGVKVQFPRTGSCSALAVWAKRNGRLLTASEFRSTITNPDSTICLFLVRARDRYGAYIEGAYQHIGFYRPYDSATIEGNSNGYGGSEGYEVVQRQRPVSDLYHYIRIV